MRPILALVVAAMLAVPMACTGDSAPPSPAANDPATVTATSASGSNSPLPSPHDDGAAFEDALSAAFPAHARDCFAPADYLTIGFISGAPFPAHGFGASIGIGGNPPLPAPLTVDAIAEMMADAEKISSSDMRRIVERLGEFSRTRPDLVAVCAAVIVPAMVAGLRDWPPEKKPRAVTALGACGAHARIAVPPLVAMLDGNECAREAAKALGAIGPAAAESIPALIAAMRAPYRTVREAAFDALVKFGHLARAAILAVPSGSDSAEDVAPEFVALRCLVAAEIQIESSVDAAIREAAITTLAEMLASPNSIFGNAGIIAMHRVRAAIAPAEWAPLLLAMSRGFCKRRTGAWSGPQLTHRDLLAEIARSVTGGMAEIVAALWASAPKSAERLVAKLALESVQAAPNAAELALAPVIAMLEATDDDELRSCGRWFFRAIAGEVIEARLYALDAPGKIRHLRILAATHEANGYGKDVELAIAKFLRRDASPDVRAVAAWALQDRFTNTSKGMVPRHALWALCESLLDEHPTVRVAAIEAVATYPDFAKNFVPRLLRLLATTTEPAIENACRTAFRRIHTAARPALERAMDGPDEPFREIVREMLGALDGPRER